MFQQDPEGFMHKGRYQRGNALGFQLQLQPPQRGSLQQPPQTKGTAVGRVCSQGQSMSVILVVGSPSSGKRSLVQGQSGDR